MTAIPENDFSVAAPSMVVRRRFVSSFENVDLPAPLGPHTRVVTWVCWPAFFELAMSEIALFHSGGELSSCKTLFLGASSEVQS